MRRQRAIAIAPCVLTALMLAIPQLLADDGGGPANVLVAVTSGTIESGENVPDATYRLVAQGSQPTEILAGHRLPIPVTTFNAEVPPAVPMTSYTYQNVGFTARLRVMDVGPDGIRLEGSIEQSRVNGDDVQPVIDARRSTVRATFTPGVAMEVLRIEGAEATSYLEVTASVMH